VSLHLEAHLSTNVSHNNANMQVEQLKNGSNALLLLFFFFFFVSKLQCVLSISLRILLKYYCSSPQVAKCFEKLEIHVGVNFVPIDLVVIIQSIPILQNLEILNKKF
jgi:hypothetical protein